MGTQKLYRYQDTSEIFHKLKAQTSLFKGESTCLVHRDSDRAAGAAEIQEVAGQPLG